MKLYGSITCAALWSVVECCAGLVQFHFLPFHPASALSSAIHALRASWLDRVGEKLLNLLRLYE
jgi:hypothetical protein